MMRTPEHWNGIEICLQIRYAMLYIWCLSGGSKEELKSVMLLVM